jgi:UDP-N-acetylglucosamine:LPS N-acetylglucosamine transferase
LGDKKKGFMIMMRSKVLYISGSIGMGHVIKDLAIINKLRKINQNVEITWIATDPASSYLKDKGEQIHTMSHKFSSYSALAEKSANKSQLNLVTYVLTSLKGWAKNVKTFRRIIRNEHYDVIVGNETYEILIALVLKLLRFNTPFIIIYDFLGLDSMTRSPLEKIVNYILNWIWSREYKVFSILNRKSIFIGVPEDIPDKKFGLLLPNRREYAKTYFTFIGYIIRFDAEMYKDKMKIRKKLGYDENPLIVCSIGGTSIGKELLELCNRAYPILKSKIKQLRMVMVTGPRLTPKDIKTFAGVEVRGFVPELYEHFAACDLAIVQGGFSSTLELTALKRPFIFFPIQGHSEQEYVANRLSRHNAGIRMDFSKTTPDSLANQVLNNIKKSVSYKSLNIDGAQNAAEIINKYLVGHRDEK